MRWEPCGQRFIEADVIRFTEAVWKPKKSPRSKPRKIGARVVTAEVLKREPGGWVRLKVRRSETTNAEDWCYTIKELAIESVIRRQVATIGRGKPTRLEWTDETARDAVLGQSKPAALGKFLR
jgi:hypothetical protein